MDQLIEFRCTRRRPYVGCDCPGKTNLSARQGYYIRDSSPDMAIMQMMEHFPEDRNFGFDVQVWQLPKGMDPAHYDEMFAINAQKLVMT
jgi:hypothetical protein